MILRTRLVPILGLILFATLAYAQPASISPKTYANLPLAELPLRDNARLLADELDARRPGRPETFAVTSDVAIRPATHGRWSDAPGARSVWRLRLRSRGAHSLNLGFSEFDLAPGAELYLLGRKTGERFGPFTPADEEDHNQLWTPLVPGDELLVELYAPRGREKQNRLLLTAVNHDFANVTNSLLSGSCNVDVVCGAADDLGIIDQYRDIIRSVAAYTLNGRDQCTGFLVNNANEDGRAYFMTANHCSVTPGAAPTLVAYWNYENSSCRPPNSTASGRNGNGSRALFNTGTVHRASYAPSDVTLLEFDDPVNPAANAFFAGWSARNLVPTDTMIAVHHPAVEEKRISFSFQDPYRAAYYGPAAPRGDHLEIPDWDLGTTEGGSSGSPVFDRFKRVRGQLHGGDAACGNDDFDSYGYFAVSWEGGGTPETRLSDWLDPCNTGVRVMDGLEQSRARRSLVADNNCLSVCRGATLPTDVTLREGFGQNVPVRVIDAPEGLVAELSTERADGGDRLVLNLSTPADFAAGTYPIVLRAGSGSVSDLLTLSLTVFSAETLAPAAIFPQTGETGVSGVATLRWEADPAQTYELQVARTADFADPVLNVTGLRRSSFTITERLAAETDYFWRIRAVTPCGDGDWSAAIAFRTGSLDCGTDSATDVPVAISSGPGNSYTSEIEVTRDVALAELEVSLSVRHTYLGDLSIDLTSPTGTTVQLLNYAVNDGCDEDDLFVTFAAGGALTHRAFTDACRPGDANAPASVRPFESLGAFAGESSVGTWTLTLNDNAPGDGGSIEAFSLNLCQSGGGRDLSLTALTESLDVCRNDGATVVLSVGADVTTVDELRVAAAGTVLDNYTFRFDAPSRELTVEFSSFTLLEERAFYPLRFTITPEPGITRQATIPLSVSAGLARPLRPLDGASPAGDQPLLFNWRGVRGPGVSYVLEIARDQAFTNVIGSYETSETEVVVEEPLEGVLFWRVVTTGPCGQLASDIRTLQFSVGVQDFGAGRSVTVFPNPSRGAVTIRLSSGWNGPLRATLLSAGGRELGFLGEQSSAGSRSYDLGHLPPGLYYLRLVHGGQQRTEKVVLLP